MTADENAPDLLSPFQRDIAELEARIGRLSNPKVKAIAEAHVAKMRAVNVRSESRD